MLSNRALFIRQATLAATLLRSTKASRVLFVNKDDFCVILSEVAHRRRTRRRARQITTNPATAPSVNGNEHILLHENLLKGRVLIEVTTYFCLLNRA